jgi:hypothetical protein
VLNERHGLDDLSNERIGNYFCGKAFRNVIDSVVDRQRVHLGSSFYEVSLNCAVIFWALFSFGAVLVVIDVCDSVWSVPAARGGVLVVTVGMVEESSFVGASVGMQVCVGEWMWRFGRASWWQSAIPGMRTFWWWLRKNVRVWLG